MEPLWSPVVATCGNWSQAEQPREPRNRAKTIAAGCDQLLLRAHGKQGVCRGLVGFANSDGRTDLCDLQRDRICEPYAIKGPVLGRLGWNSDGTEGAQPVAKVRVAERPKMACPRAEGLPPAATGCRLDRMVRNAMKKGLPRSDAPRVLGRRREARFNVVRRFGSQPQASRLPSA
jgi:hypothetical protein